MYIFIFKILINKILFTLYFYINLILYIIFNIILFIFYNNNDLQADHRVE